MRSVSVVLLLSSLCVAQASKPTVRFSTDTLVIQANDTRSISACNSVGSQSRCFDPHKPGQIKVFELVSPDTPEVHANDVTSKFVTDDVSYSEFTQESLPCCGSVVKSS